MLKFSGLSLLKRGGVQIAHMTGRPLSQQSLRQEDTPRPRRVAMVRIQPLLVGPSASYGVGLLECTVLHQRGAQSERHCLADDTQDRNLPPAIWNSGVRYRQSITASAYVHSDDSVYSSNASSAPPAFSECTTECRDDFRSCIPTLDSQRHAGVRIRRTDCVCTRRCLGCYRILLAGALNRDARPFPQTKGRYARPSYSHYTLKGGSIYGHSA